MRTSKTGDGPRIRQELLNGLLDVLEKRIPEMPFDIPMELKQICGSEFWDARSPRDQKLMGEVASYLVDEDELRLVKVEWEHEYPLKYVSK